MRLEDFYIWIFKLWVDLEMLEELERTVGGSGKCRKDWRQNLKKGKICVWDPPASGCLGTSALWAPLAPSLPFKLTFSIQSPWGYSSFVWGSDSMSSWTGLPDKPNWDNWIW